MMRIGQSMASNWPLSMITVPQLAASLPLIADVYDAHRVSQTSAVGNWLETIRGAFGEFLERRHFYNEIAVSNKSKINSMTNQAAANAFSHALEQTAEDFSTIDKHYFYTVPVFNLFTFQPDFAPAICVALTNKGMGADSTYLPFRDTTGCAAHVNPVTALDSALGELIERQCLLRYWMTCIATFEIDASNVNGQLRPDVAVVMEKLSQSGELTIYDISLPEIPGYTVLALYGAYDVSRAVQYAAGLSYAMRPTQAVEKAILELWQIFALLHYSIVSGFDGNTIEDFYHRHFWNMNDITSYRTMTNTEVSGHITLGKYIAQPPESRHTVYRHVHTLTPHVFSYIGRDQIGATAVTMVRVFSPDLFLHMNGAAPLNHENAISQFFPSVCQNRKSSLVLFP